MIFNNDSRTRILMKKVEVTFDPATATIELKIDTTWYPAEWTAAATVTGTAPNQVWTRAARTTGYFAGPNAVASGATVLTAGRHLTETRVTNGGDIIVEASSPIDVK